MKTDNIPHKKPVFKWAWQKIESGDYIDIISFKKAMKEYNKLVNQKNKRNENR